MRALGFDVKKPDIIKLVHDVDPNNSGAVDYDQFLEISTCDVYFWHCHCSYYTIVFTPLVTDKYGERDPDDEISKAFQVNTLLNLWTYYTISNLISPNQPTNYFFDKAFWRWSHRQSEPEEYEARCPGAWRESVRGGAASHDRRVWPWPGRRDLKRRVHVHHEAVHYVLRQNEGRPGVYQYYDRWSVHCAMLEKFII